MPSAKPDKNEIYWLMRERNIEGAPEESLLTEVRLQCRAIAGEGFITPSGATALLSWLDRNPDVASLFPSSSLALALRQALVAGCWTPATEEALLRFISCFYLPDDFDSVAPYLIDMFSEPHFLFGDLYSGIFDHLEERPNLAKKFVCFTGTFKSGTRLKCFERARELGGVPAESRGYIDYIFISDEHIQRHSFSSKLTSAILNRASYGRMLLLKESDWDRFFAA